MSKYWLWLATAAFGIEMIICENCSTISVQPSDIAKWTLDIDKIEFLIEYNCSSTYNLTLLWTLNSTAKEAFDKGNISSSSPLKFAVGKLSFLEYNGTFMSNITLASDSMENSFLVVTAVPAEDIIDLVFQPCEDGQDYNTKLLVQCSIPNLCPGESDAAGHTSRTCGKNAEFIFDKCERDEYTFNFTTAEFEAPKGNTISITCDNLLLYDGIVHNQTVERSLEFADHGKQITCYKESVNETDAKNATVNVTSSPDFSDAKTEFQAVEGEPFSLRLVFYANPQVMKSDVRIWHSGNPISDFFFRTVTEISQEVMIDIPKVAKDDLGIYNVTITGKNEYCKDVSTTKVVDIVPVAKSLTTGWIVAIGLGGLAFVLLIAVIWNGVAHCRRKEKSFSPNVTPKYKPNNSNFREENFQKPDIKLQSSHANQSFDDDDEFDDDEYEQPNSPMSDRPPMPLPASTRGGAPPPPKSPRNVGRSVSDRPQFPPPSPNRGRPPPPSASRPPPPHRGVMPSPTPRGVGAGNTLAIHTPGYEPRDYQEDYLNEDESLRAATLGMRHMRR